MFCCPGSLRLLQYAVWFAVGRDINVAGKVWEASLKGQKLGSWYTSVSLEFINGIRTVQAFAAQDFERDGFMMLSCS